MIVTNPHTNQPVNVAPLFKLLNDYHTTPALLAERLDAFAFLLLEVTDNRAFEDDGNEIKNMHHYLRGLRDAFRQM